MALMQDKICIIPGGAGLSGSPGVYAYCTAKYAQTVLMRSLAKEVAPRGIRVNTMIPMCRHARPEEIARSVLYLASDLSSFVTGSQLAVDGGISSRQMLPTFIWQGYIFQA